MEVLQGAHCSLDKLPIISELHTQCCLLSLQISLKNAQLHDLPKSSPAVHDVCAKTKSAACLNGDSLLIASHHFDLKFD